MNFTSFFLLNELISLIDDFGNDCLVNATSSSNNFDLPNDTGPSCNPLILNNSNSDNAFGNDHLSVDAGPSFYSFFAKDTFREDQFSGDTSPNSEVMTESVSTDSEDYEDLEDWNNILELKIRLTFVNWVEFKAWLDSFAKNQRISYRVRTSQMDGEVTCRATYECSRSGIHESQLYNEVSILDDLILLVQRQVIF
ncbi:9606_t:CDS:2 [Scutellospora calospora]|uniref:9606_t:CDS:1 n=1 Tax=Scutellospora calospora TaxID=85575 RepID=A0ACA9KWV9_9GLOM|nr:9606_t:CDS:2 [Scutellospora calospora]